MSINKRTKQAKKIVGIIEKLSPYMPPELKETHFVWFDGKVLYMTIINEKNVYQERLGNILKEELDFIEEIKFIQRSKLNDKN